MHVVFKQIIYTHTYILNTYIHTTCDQFGSVFLLLQEFDDLTYRHLLLGLCWRLRFLAGIFCQKLLTVICMYECMYICMNFLVGHAYIHTYITTKDGRYYSTKPISRNILISSSFSCAIHTYIHHKSTIRDTDLACAAGIPRTRAARRIWVRVGRPSPAGTSTWRTPSSCYCRWAGIRWTTATAIHTCMYVCMYVCMHNDIYVLQTTKPGICQKKAHDDPIGLTWKYQVRVLSKWVREESVNVITLYSMLIMNLIR